MNLLQRAIEIAVQAHAGQVDKGGNLYVLHPLHVMLRMATDEERIVAVLHDVIEDTSWTLPKLAAEGFPPAILAALHNLTRNSAEDYETFILRSASNPLSAIVKLADLEDNSDLSRIKSPTTLDYERKAKYQRAIEQIRSSWGGQSCPQPPFRRPLFSHKTSK
jgi:(p)ppGpp synthase/HD superfamily hydrolase